MKKTKCWAIKLKHGKFVNRPVIHNYWESERAILFRTRKYAEDWLKGNPFWEGRGEVVRVIVTIREEDE